MKTLDNYTKACIIQIDTRKRVSIYERVGKYIMRGKKPMNTKQLNSYLEAIKIIAQNAAEIVEIIKAIEQLQDKLNE